MSPGWPRRYQKKRMYARIALGKASSIDIIGGETSGMPGQLLAMLPFLFLLQAWQLFMGANMMRHSAPAMLDPEGWLARSPPAPPCPSSCSQPTCARREACGGSAQVERSLCVCGSDRYLAPGPAGGAAVLCRHTLRR